MKTNKPLIFMLLIPILTLTCATSSFAYRGGFGGIHPGGLGNGFNHPNDFHNYNDFHNNVGNYHPGTGWVAPAVILDNGVMTNDNYNTNCITTQQCDSYGNCNQTQECN